MITRIEIDGFKSFSNFSLDLRPLTAIVGPNASGKSNFFDAMRFLSLLAQTDIRSAMQGLRGDPEELFRRTPNGNSKTLKFAVELYLNLEGIDSFSNAYAITAQRLRYEIELVIQRDKNSKSLDVVVRNEKCRPIAKKDETALYLDGIVQKYNARVNPFIRLSEDKSAIEIRQDGRQKHGRPLSLPIKNAARTALSTITTSEFPHLYAVKDALSNIRFLEINPVAARDSNDRFEDRILKSDASNLSAVLTRLRDQTAEKDWPDGVLNDIAADLGSLIPSVGKIVINDDEIQKRYSFDLRFEDSMQFSSRVISDGTVRLLALLTILHDPERSGSLCFEEPENGVHEGRIPRLIEYLRDAVSESLTASELEPFQVILNTHSPKVMNSLLDKEIVAADVVQEIDPGSSVKSNRTRMRSGVSEMSDLIDPEHYLTRAEVARLLQNTTDAA
jgi:predicted ATPase